MNFRTVLRCKRSKVVREGTNQGDVSKGVKMKRDMDDEF